MNTQTVTSEYRITGIGQRSIAAVVASATAIVLPQLTHLIGSVTNTGTAAAQAWLPMFLPVLLVGLLAGPRVGAFVGFGAPIIANLLTGFPVPSMLPFLIVQLVVAGGVAGLISRRSLAVVWSTIIVVVAAPLVLLVARCGWSVMIGGNLLQSIATWGTQIATQIPGLSLQLVAVAITLAWIRRRR